MGELFWNKVFGAGLATLLAVFALKEGAHMLVHPHELEEPAYVIEVPEETADGGAVEAEPVDLGTLLAEANPNTGSTFARTLCGSCHNFEEGGPTITGPNLYDVVGRDVAAVDFAFTAAMNDLGGEWSYEHLWTFLENPARAVPGTAMTFAGLAREDQRANVIAYLATLSSDPVPFPAPLAAEAEPGAADGADEAAGDEPEDDAADAASDEAEDE